MIKKCLFLCVLFIFKTECCVDDFFKCFSEFTESFFKTDSKIDHVNATVDIPEEYKQVKDVRVESIEDLTSAIQKELFKRIKSETVDLVVTDNPKTKIYVKTFSYDFDFIPNFSGFDFESDESEEEGVKSIQFESKTTNSDKNNEFSTEFVTLSSDDMSNTDSQNETDEITHENVTFQTSLLQENITKESNVTSEINEPPLKLNHNTTSIVTLELEEKLENYIKTLDKQEIYEQESTTPTTIKRIVKAKENKSIIVKLSNNNKKITINIPETISKNDTVEYTTQNVQENTKKIPNKYKINASTKPDQSMASISITEKQFEKDIRENLIEDDESDYVSDDSTDYPQIDYIDLYKDTTNEENIYVPTTNKPKTDIKDEIIENIEEYTIEIDTGMDHDDNSTSICHGNTSDVSNIFPWIATIFIKNDSANQFQYICDGALSSEKLIITAARCFTIFNSSVTSDDVLVFLGKRSLQVMAEGERNVRVQKIILHSNFSEDGPNGQVVNDLALLVLEDEVTFTDDIRPACFGVGDGKSATTAWSPTGELKPVFFEKPSASCDATQGTVCATYGNEVPLCPSYGGIVARRHTTHWYLHGIRTGDVSDRGLCFSKDVLYTPLGDHLDWIMEFME